MRHEQVIAQEMMATSEALMHCRDQIETLRQRTRGRILREQESVQTLLDSGPAVASALQQLAVSIDGNALARHFAEGCVEFSWTPPAPLTIGSTKR